MTDASPGSIYLGVTVTSVRCLRAAVCGWATRARSCRIECVGYAHTYALIGIFTRNRAGRLETATIGKSASPFVYRARQ